MLTGYNALLLAQEGAPTVPPVVIGLAIGAFALFVMSGYLLFVAMPRLKSALQSRDEEVDKLEMNIKVNERTTNTLREEHSLASKSQRDEQARLTQQFEGRVSELKAEVASRAESDRLASQLKCEQLDTHVLRRCQRRVTDDANVVACAKSDADRRIRDLEKQLAETSESLRQQRQSAALERHVQRRLQSRLEDENYEQALDLEHVVIHARSVERHVGFLAHTATSHRRQGTKLKHGLTKTQQRERRLATRLASYESADRDRQRKIAALTAQLKEL